MKFKGIYTVIQDGNVIATSKNQIQTDGFRLVQNWFANTQISNIKGVDINDSQKQVSITSKGLTSENMNDVSELFLGYTGRYFYTTDAGAEIQISFKDGETLALQKRKIAAIGLDIIRMPMVDQETYEEALKTNSNIQFRYNTTDIINELEDRSDFIIPVAIKSDSFIKGEVGFEQKMFYLNSPKDISQIKLSFNTFHDNYIRYTIYAINIYEDNEFITPPTHMSLYDELGNIVFHKQIQFSCPNNSNGYSTIFKTTIPYDYFSGKETTLIKAISTDYYEQGVRKQFSYSTYETSWSQQQFTNVQLQYQLFFSNVEVSDNTDV